MGGGIAHLNWILKEELKKSIKKLSLYRSMNNSIYVRPNNAVFLVNKRCIIRSTASTVSECCCNKNALFYIASLDGCYSIGWVILRSSF